MVFKMKGWSGSPMNQNSPMKQGGLVECPECDWEIEATNDPAYDQQLLMEHVLDIHLGGSTDPGTPGYTPTIRDEGRTPTRRGETTQDRQKP